MRTRTGRGGTAAVELAICLPLLLIVLTGIWEVGRMVTAQQLITNAAREAGRVAAAGQKDSTAVRQVAVDYLNMNGLTGVTLSDVVFANLTNPALDPTAANQMDQLRVTITVPCSTIRYSTLAQITTTTTLTASADWYSMRDLPVNVSMTIPVN